MDAMESFDVLEVNAGRMNYAGEVLEVKALPIGKLPAFARAIKSVFPVLRQIDEAAERGDDVFDLSVEFIEQHSDNLQQAVSIATGKPREFIAEGGLTEFFALLRLVMEVNRDFFGQPFGQPVRETLVRTVGTSPGHGQEASSS